MFEYLRNDSLEVNIINDNVYITNYLEVLSFSREEILTKEQSLFELTIGILFCLEQKSAIPLTCDDFAFLTAYKHSTSLAIAGEIKKLNENKNNNIIDNNFFMKMTT